MNKIINRDIIKYVAMITMLLNHMACIFLVSGTFLYEILNSIGYFTGTVMIYFLVEGYYHTKSRKKYFGRLLLFALISQIPYFFAFTENGGRLNMMFSLCICYFLIRGLDKCPGLGEKILVFVIAFIMSFFCDWPLLAPIFTLTFFLGNGNKKKLQLAFGLNIICFWIFEFLDKKEIMSLNEAMLYSLLSIVGVGIAALCILHFYNGKRAEHGKNFSKWFFYIFYPTHLLILGIVERLIEIN
jgi:hypothetical protein